MGNIKSILSNIEHLSEFSDDHSEYPQRPSLDFYKKYNFNMKYNEKSQIYGDFRDRGYILSFEDKNHGRDDNLYPIRVEGSKYVFRHIEHVADVEIPSLASELGIKIKKS